VGNDLKRMYLHKNVVILSVLWDASFCSAHWSLSFLVKIVLWVRLQTMTTRAHPRGALSTRWGVSPPAGGQKPKPLIFFVNDACDTFSFFRGSRAPARAHAHTRNVYNGKCATCVITAEFCRFGGRADEPVSRRSGRAVSPVPREAPGERTRSAQTRSAPPGDLQSG
jgi:hypothetical protein